MDKLKKNEKIEKNLENIEHDIKEQDNKINMTDIELLKVMNEVDGYKKVMRENENQKKTLEAVNYK